MNTSYISEFFFNIQNFLTPFSSSNWRKVPHILGWMNLRRPFQSQY